MQELSFQKALLDTGRNEGRYANDPDDPGAETMYGVTYSTYLGWCGLSNIRHLYKGDTKSPKIELGGNLDTPIPPGSLMNLSWATASAIYYELYWIDPNFHYVADVREDISIELFDCGVNQGVYRAAGFLQKSLNLCNDREHLWADIWEDGDIGPATIEALRQALRGQRIGMLLKVFDAHRTEHYMELMRANPVREKFGHSWFRRI